MAPLSNTHTHTHTQTLEIILAKEMKDLNI